MKIIDYKLATGEPAVTAALAQGYQPYGDPFLKYDGGSVYTLQQAMVKTDPPPKLAVKGYVAVETIPTIKSYATNSKLELYGSPLSKGNTIVQVMVHREAAPPKLSPKPNNLDSGNQL